MLKEHELLTVEHSSKEGHINYVNAAFKGRVVENTWLEYEREQEMLVRHIFGRKREARAKLNELEGQIKVIDERIE